MHNSQSWNYKSKKIILHSSNNQLSNQDNEYLIKKQRILSFNKISRTDDSLTYNICENDRAQIKIISARTAGGKNTCEYERHSDIHHVWRISLDLIARTTSRGDRT